MKITLKEKKLKSGMISLYIEYYKGTSVNAEGKRTHLRDFEYLKLYQHENPKTASEKKNNKENLELAESILAVRKADFVQGKFGLKNNNELPRGRASRYQESKSVSCPS